VTTNDHDGALPGATGTHPVTRIEEEHRALRTQLDLVAAATTREGLLERLRPLPKMLLEHFAFEEQSDGLHDDLQDRCPTAAPKLALLHDDHKQILGELDSLCQLLRSPADDPGNTESGEAAEELGASAARELALWLQKLRNHESAESRIVADIYYTDEGGRG